MPWHAGTMTEPEPSHPDQFVERPVAFVTGAARGIGAASARRLAADGWAVVLADICADIAAIRYPMGSSAELDAVVAECGPYAMAVTADVRDDAQLDAAVAAGVERFGGLDAVVAAAGVIGGGDATWKLTDDTWLTNMDINLSGVWRTFRATVPALLDRPRPRSGRVVAIASAAGMKGNPSIADYTAAKHGVVGLVRSMALELAPHGITVNAIAPGSTNTAILQASADVYGITTGEFAVHHPIGRNLEPSEIAAGVSWLCDGDRGAVTGIVLPIDGGMTL